MPSQTTHPPTDTAFGFESLPLYQAIEPQTQEGLKLFCTSGNASHRAKQVQEWLKALDWLSWEEMAPTMGKLPESLRRLLKRDIQAYRHAQADVRAKQSEQRKQYQLNVMTYFKENVPPKDKALLESLRDYELNKTGRDANWQHHFSFKSYKKIDAFVSASRMERAQAIALFQADVAAYVKNKEKWQRMAIDADESGPIFDFDDWCDWVSEDPDAFQQQQKQAGNRQQKTNNTAHRHLPLSILKALTTMGLTEEADWGQAKQQFRSLTLKYHPDMPEGDESRMKTILEAYALLKRHFNG